MLRIVSTSPRRALLVAVLLCVLAIRVIVPQGYMWAADAKGTPVMTVCLGMSASPAMPGRGMPHHAPHQQHDSTTADHPCAFAAAGAAVDLAAVLHPLVTRTGSRNDVPPRLNIFVRPGLGLAAPPPPKTGPPSLA